MGAGRAARDTGRSAGHRPVPLPAVATVNVLAGAGVPSVIWPTSSTATHSEAEVQSIAVRSVPGMSAPRTAQALASPVGCVEVYA